MGLLRSTPSQIGGCLPGVSRVSGEAHGPARGSRRRSLGGSSLLTKFANHLSNLSVHIPCSEMLVFLRCCGILHWTASGSTLLHIFFLVRSCTHRARSTSLLPLSFFNFPFSFVLFSSAGSGCRMRRGHGMREKTDGILVVKYLAYLRYRIYLSPPKVL